MALDPKFLEWFGQMLQLSAKNIEQAEGFFRLFREGLPQGRQTEKWLEPYLQPAGEGKGNPAEDFQALARELFRNLGVVSRQEYDQLQKEHERLKAEFEEFKKSFEQVRGVETEARRQSPAVAEAWLDMVKQATQANTRLFDLYRKWLGLRS